MKDNSNKSIDKLNAHKLINSDDNDVQIIVILRNSHVFLDMFEEQKKEQLKSNVVTNDKQRYGNR